jgi:hypothetical protein
LGQALSEEIASKATEQPQTIEAERILSEAPLEEEPIVFDIPKDIYEPRFF